MSIAAASVLLACAVLFGWAIESTFLISLLASAVNMQPLTAIGLAAAGVATGAAYLRLDAVRYAATAVLMALAFAALLEYALSLDLGFDRLLFTDQILRQSPMPVHPGRTSVLICATFALLGASLLLVSARDVGLRMAAVVAAALGLLLSLLLLLAYLILNGEPLRVMNGGLGAPLHGAVATAALCVAALLLRRETGWVRLFLAGGEQARLARLLAPVALVPVAIAFCANQGLVHGLYEPDVRMLLITELSATALLLLSLWAADRLGHGRDELANLASALDLSTVFIRAPDGAIEHWPKGCEALYGWTREQAVGRNSHELLHTVFPRPLKDLKIILFQKGSWSGELLHHTREGEDRWVAAQWVIEDRGPDHPPASSRRSPTSPS